MEYKHYVVEQTTRFHVYAPDQDAVMFALDNGAINPDETEDHETTVSGGEPVDAEQLRLASTNGIPVLDEDGLTVEEYYEQ